MSKFLSTEERAQLALVLQHSIDRHTDSDGATTLHLAAAPGLVERLINTVLGTDVQQISDDLPGAVRRALTESDAPLADAVDVLLDEFEDDEVEAIFDSVRDQLALPPASPTVSVDFEASVSPEDIIGDIVAGALALPPASPTVSVDFEASVSPEDIIGDIVAGALALGLHPSNIRVIRASDHPGLDIEGLARRLAS